MLRRLYRHSDSRSRRRGWTLVLLALALVFVVEGYRTFVFYSDVSASKSQLTAIKNDLDISRLQQSEAEVLSKQAKLRDASERLKSASKFVKSDPLIVLARPFPWVGEQLDGLKALVIAADEATRTGLTASEIALAYARYQRDANKTSIEDALAFLKQQEQAMAEVNTGLQSLKQRRDDLPDGLIGPMGTASKDLDTAVEKLEGLVEGYTRANALLPGLLGYEGRKRYLVLPQNDTELFPSGGLISSYGVATFDGGKLVSMDLEYFGTLYDRWQRNTREYIEPPGPLKNYLKRNFSWGLGEAGWYPDFPTTGNLARSFTAKGGVQATDGVIAIDLQFISALLKLIGPVEVPDYKVTVTPENVSELTLEMTRDEAYKPNQPQAQTEKAFLSYLSKEVLNRIFTAPKEQWPELLRLLDQMGRERHLQLNFTDERLQSLSAEYGLDGAIAKTSNDYLMLADTSVNSTKLNLILRTKARLDLALGTENATSQISYQIHNPFADWSKGRSPQLVKALMLDGVYGSYWRVYVPEQAELKDARVEGKSVGVEQNALELGKRVFGRFFPVMPSQTQTATFVYETKGVVKKTGKTYTYQLDIQKQAGTAGLPLEIRATLPKGADLKSVRVDGKSSKKSPVIHTDLRIDRTIEIVFTMP